MSNYRIMVFTLIVSMVGCGLASSVRAQSIWMPPTDAPYVRLEAYKADYNSDYVSDTKFLTSVWVLTGAVKLSSVVALFAEVPYSHYDPYDPSGTFEAESVIGSPYLGVLFGSSNSVAVGEFGLRLPTVSEDYDNARVNGFLTDFSRFEAFVPDYLTFRLRGGPNVTNGTGQLTFRFLVGGSLLWSDEHDDELIVDADASLWYRPSNITIGTVLSGRHLATDTDASFSERSEFALAFAGLVRLGRWEPGVSLRLPIGNEGWWAIGELVNVVLGANVTVHLGSSD